MRLMLVPLGGSIAHCSANIRQYDASRPFILVFSLHGLYLSTMGASEFGSGGSQASIVINARTYQLGPGRTIVVVS